MNLAERLLGGAPEKSSVQDLARGFVLTIGRRTQTLIEFLEKEGLAQEALRGRFALSPGGFSYQCLIFLAFPFYAMMAAEFGAHGERVGQEFVRALIETMFEEEGKLSPAEFAESEQLIVGTFDEYNKVWQSGETVGQITMRLGALAFERILGRQGGPPNYRVWDLLFKETNKVFKSSVGIGKRFKIVA